MVELSEDYDLQCRHVWLQALLKWSSISQADEALKAYKERFPEPTSPSYRDLQKEVKSLQEALAEKSRQIEELELVLDTYRG